MPILVEVLLRREACRVLSRICESWGMSPMLVLPQVVGLPILIQVQLARPL